MNEPTFFQKALMTYSSLDRARYVSTVALLKAVEELDPKKLSKDDNPLQPLLHTVTEEFGISFQQLERATGIPRSTLRGWSLGRSLPSLRHRKKTVAKLKKALTDILVQRLSQLPPLEPEY